MFDEPIDEKTVMKKMDLIKITQFACDLYGLDRNTRIFYNLLSDLFDAPAYKDNSQLNEPAELRRVLSESIVSVTALKPPIDEKKTSGNPLVDVIGHLIAYDLEEAKIEAKKQTSRILNESDESIVRQVRFYREKIEPIIKYGLIRGVDSATSQLERYYRRQLFKSMFPREEYKRKLDSVNDSMFDLYIASLANAKAPRLHVRADELMKKAEDAAKKEFLGMMERKKDIFSKIIELSKTGQVGYSAILTYANELPTMNRGAVLDDEMKPGDILRMYVGKNNSVLDFPMERFAFKENGKVDLFTTTIGSDEFSRGEVTYDEFLEDFTKLTLMYNLAESLTRNLQGSPQSEKLSRVLIYERKEDGKRFLLK